MLTRRLEERERVESKEERRREVSVSSCWVSNDAALEVVRLSERPCGWRRGGGTGFLVGWGVEDGALMLACDALGALAGMMMLSPGWISSSGTLPAASRSNTLSASFSRGDLCGGAGSGLCRSDGVGGLFCDGTDCLS